MNISMKIAALCTSVLLATGLGVAGASTALASPPVAPATAECIPRDAYTETVVVQEEYLQRYSYNGPWESNTTSPPFPSDDWQANVKGDPHKVGVPGAYFRSNENSGKGDWFYLELVPAITKIVEHPAVTCPPPPPPPPADDPECITAVWQMPSWVGPQTPTWPQSLVSYVSAECYDLDVEVPNTCETQYQVDSYLDNQTTANLLTGGVLTGPSQPLPESFPPNPGWDRTYKLVQNTDICVEEPPVDEPPVDEPEPPVVEEPPVAVDGPPTLADTGINARGAVLGIGALVLIALGVVAYLWSRYNRKN